MDKPIRVLHVIGIMNRGGAETMIMNLYRHIDRSKVQFDFVENSSEPAIFDEEIISLGGRIYRCPHYNGKITLPMSSGGMSFPSTFKRVSYCAWAFREYGSDLSGDCEEIWGIYHRA